MKNSFLSNNSIIFSFDGRLGHPVYRVLRRDAILARNGQRLLLGHSRRTQTARKQKPRHGFVSRLRGTEITGCVLNILDSFMGELAALIIPRVATLGKVWLH